MSEKNGVTQADLSECDKEPIHIPGSIQRHGVLLAFNPQTEIVEVASGNAADFLGVPSSSILGSPVREILEGKSYAESRRVLSIPDMIGLQNINVKVGQKQGQIYDGILHHSGEYDILELEPFLPVAENFFLQFYHNYKKELSALQNAGSADELFKQACLLIKKITGYERVWIYQFDPDWNGKIVAEEKEEHLTSYYGLHYPASDIPEQARRLYTTNRLRLIADVNSTPVPLQYFQETDTKKNIDLSLSVLRAISPVHIEYMQNMGVTATLTISLVRSGNLTGLISCHDHRGSRFVPYEVRRACEFLGFLLSQQLGEINARERNRVFLQTGTYVDQMSQNLTTEKELDQLLLHEKPSLLDLIEAQGAAFVRAGEVYTIGSTPEKQEIVDITEWLWEKGIKADYNTNCLSKEYPNGESMADTASGILAFSLSREGKDWVIWFREEVVQTVTWGGDPNKPVTKDPHTGRIHPRKSFEKWKEKVRFCSRHWDAYQIDAIRPFAGNLMRFLRLLDAEQQYVTLKQLHQSQKMESIGVLAGGIAHDFNNILSAIIGFTELSFEDAEPNSDLRDNLDQIYAAGNRAKLLVKQILTFAHQSHEETKVFQFSKVIEDTLRMISSVKPPSIRVEQYLTSQSTVKGNETEFHQVIVNLCTNAIQAMQDGGTLAISLKDKEITEDHPTSEKLPIGARCIELIVADSGPGITEKIIDKIFDPYFTTKGIGKGTGMGLALTRGIVESYGGHISVESVLGEGTTFTILLPVSEGESVAPKEERSNAVGTGNEHILLVDDEEPLVRLGHRILESLGYRVTITTSSSEALQFFQNNPNDFDLLISDIMMPEMNGEELVAEIRKITPDIPVILCTGYTDIMDKEKAQELGVQAFAYKPFTKVAMAELIREVLDRV